MLPGRRLLPGSLRFRLTAWYALLLAAVLAILGLSVLGLTGDRLRRDVDRRLERSAADIERTLWKETSNWRVAWINDRQSLTWTSLSLDSFAARGLKVVVLGAHGAVVKDAPYARQLAMAVPPEPPPSGKVALATIAMDRADLRIVRYPVAYPFGDSVDVVGTIVVGEPLGPLYDTLAELRGTLVTTSVAGLALAVLGGWLLADRALRPVDRVTAAAAAIADGDGTAASLGTRLHVPATGDEIARLSGTFNAMLDRLQAAFVAQQRFVADASHELRTPLTAIRGNVDVLARQVAALDPADDVDGDLDAALGDVKRESARMGRLLDDLLLLARADAPANETFRRRPVRLDLVARDAVRSAAPLVAGQRLEVVAAEEVTISGDPDRLLQLLLILVENALRHTPPGGGVAIEVSPPAAGAARVVVRDEGDGIAPEHLPHLFDRFYRADGARGRATGGTGLGLAIARAIARGHGGEIAVESSPGRGSVFSVTLPAGSVAGGPKGQLGDAAPPAIDARDVPSLPSRIS